MIKVKLNNQIVCFCSSRNTSFLHEEKKKKKEKPKYKHKKYPVVLHILSLYCVLNPIAHKQPWSHSSYSLPDKQTSSTVQPTDSKKETIKVTEIILNETSVICNWASITDLSTKRNIQNSKCNMFFEVW